MKASPENTFLESKESLAELAAELHVSPRRLVSEIISQRRMVELEKETAKPQLDQNNVVAIARHSDKLAEKFGTVNSDFEGHGPEWAKEMRDTMRKDPAAIAARKIIRALPIDCDCVVTTKLGWEVVTINRVESVPNPELIAAKLEFAKVNQKRAAEKLHAATIAAERKTNLRRMPKETKAELDSAAAKLDRRNAKVAKLESELAFAKKGASASGLRYVKVADVRLSLKAQYMANRVAKIARILPIRKDVHPFRELPTIHEVTGSSFVSGIESPESALLRHEREQQHQAELARLRAMDAEKRAAEIAAKVYAYDVQFRDAMKSQTDSLNRAKRALAARNRRRDAKINLRKFR